jgi:hypothetical protein
LWKRVLAGLLVFLQKEIFGRMEKLVSPPADPAAIEESLLFARRELSLSFGEPPSDPEETRLFLLNLFNRPIRVCGMVKNQGDPGGAPFFVRERDGSFSLQIVEGAQVDPKSAEQMKIFRSSTHFNPVDIVCGVHDFKGKKFDLSRFVDHDAFFVSRKSMEGKELKALELPGLWNGSMSKWNTVFVDVPMAAFHPVKTVNDLLLPDHQAGTAS